MGSPSRPMRSAFVITLQDILLPPCPAAAPGRLWNLRSILCVPAGEQIQLAAKLMLQRGGAVFVRVGRLRAELDRFVFFLIGMMLPMQTALVPINIIYSKLNLLNTYFGLFYVYIGFGISYCILIMRGFMLGIPKDIDEAACIDGCNKWQLFYKIILPIAKPAIATLFITDFLSTWNEYLLASVIINDNAMKTVPVGIMTFVGEHGTDYGYLCAGVLVSVIPVMVVYLIFQRYFVEGMAGAVKS